MEESGANIESVAATEVPIFALDGLGGGALCSS